MPLLDIQVMKFTSTTIAAITLRAKVVEHHFTLDQKLEDGDHAASLEPGDLARLCQYNCTVEDVLGNPIKNAFFRKGKLCQIDQFQCISNTHLKSYHYNAGDVSYKGTRQQHLTHGYRRHSGKSCTM